MDEKEEDEVMMCVRDEGIGMGEGEVGDMFEGRYGVED